MKKTNQNKEFVDGITRDLERHRREIDQIDEKLLDLISSRFSIVKEIGKIKDHANAAVIDTARESHVIQRLFSLNRDGLLPQKALFQIFTAIISASRSIQQAGLQQASEMKPPSIFTVIGNPISHSLSPTMHNSAFSAVGYHGLYLPLELDDIGLAVSGLKALRFSGASITIPHKVAVMEFLDEIDEMALEIKAVNTIANLNGRLKGYNTDFTGAIRALSTKTDIKDRDVTVIGAGGAARAIGFGVKSEGGRLTIVNRSKEKGEKLAGALDAAFIPLSDLTQLDCDILINTTAVGMAPHIDSMPVPKEVLDKHMVVMDIVYNPLKTRLLKEAEHIGCSTIDGVCMFIYQGAGQFELWTKLKAPVDIMKLAVLAALDEYDA
ncbi:MAG: shikimate dehydrogenase [Desulfobacterales bacterium]|jgi:shikimate dehydrogenase